MIDYKRDQEIYNLIQDVGNIKSQLDYTGPPTPLDPPCSLGPTDPSGSSSLTGPTGPTGSPDLTGPLGLIDPTGPTDLSGPSGPSGPTDPAGSPGPPSPPDSTESLTIQRQFRSPNGRRRASRSHSIQSIGLSNSPESSTEDMETSVIPWIPSSLALVEPVVENVYTTTTQSISSSSIMLSSVMFLFIFK